MDILAAEKDLETKLKSDIVNITIEAYPDNPDTYNAMGPNGAILIQYNGSPFDDMDLNAIRGKRVNQLRTVEWLFTVLHPNLFTHGGIYARIEQIRESLTGYTVNSLVESSVMYPVSDKLVGRDPDKRLWEHDIVFKFTIPESEVFQ